MKEKKAGNEAHLTSMSSLNIPSPPQIPGPDDPRLPPDEPQIPDIDIPTEPQEPDLDIHDEPRLLDSDTFESRTPYDIIRLRINSPNRYYSSLQSTDISRGDVLRKACEEALPNDILQINIGRFELDFSNVDIDKNTDLIFPENVKIQGRGMKHTVLYAKKDGDGRQGHYLSGMPFQLTNSIIEDLTLICDADSKSGGEEEDAQTIGYASDSNFSVYRRNERNEVVTYTSVISRCRIVSNAWGFFSWNNYGDRCDFFDCEIISGRQGVSMMGWGSNSTNNEINIYRCKFVINGKEPNVGRDLSRTDRDCYTSARYKDCKNNKEYSLSYPAGGGIYGVVCRSGKVKVIDCDFHLTASKTLTLARCVGISDTFTLGSKKSPRISIQSFNNRFYITSHGARDSYAHLKMKEQSILYSQNDYVEGGMMNNLFLSSNRERQQDDESKRCSIVDIEC